MCISCKTIHVWMVLIFFTLTSTKGNAPSTGNSRGTQRGYSSKQINIALLNICDPPRENRAYEFSPKG